jgi:flagellar basal-body rod protein FlgB
MAGLKLFNLTHRLLELSLRARGVRHEILSANIANADTPGYRPKDLDFKSIMHAATELNDFSGEAREVAIDTMLAQPRDLQSAIVSYGGTEERQGDDRLDGNGVSLDRQMAMMTENSLAYEASLTLLSRTLANLRYVIAEGRK